MGLIIGLLTLVLVLTSLLLILLILVQLPKKEAGLGMAFGGAAADALFGAGSGTVLSRWTKYGAGAFLVLSLVLSVLRNHEARASGRNILSELGRTPVVTPAQPGLTSPAPVLTPIQFTNQFSSRPTNLVTTNLPAAMPVPTNQPTGATNSRPGGS